VSVKRKIARRANLPQSDGQLQISDSRQAKAPAPHG
jgi:hypothetical protein